MRFTVNEKGCWNFDGPLDKAGYGKVSLKEKSFRAHRLIAHVCIKPLMSDTEFVAHKCDNPRCINPDHLFITSPLGNMQDRDAKGRGARGSKSPLAKLSEKDIHVIRGLYAGGKSYSKIAAGYPQISVGCIQAIVTRRTWKHVP
ncbi:MAG: HNH endonuclease [Sulfuricaulis sp.]|nr:HNH endonuclease [Sulfuricaulis sp.]